MNERIFGETKDGAVVKEYRLQNRHGNFVTLLNYGATITSIVVGTEKGTPTDVLLGYKTIAEYEDNDGYLGAAIGRVGNRIGGAAFVMDGVRYEVASNDGHNHLHGGRKGFDKRIFSVSEDAGENGLRFSYTSEDGEEGYPGQLRVSILYTFDDDNRLSIAYEAVGDKDTPVNLTNHAYFNLSGEADGSIREHRLQILASQFTEIDDACLSTGVIQAVEGTPFDFRKPTTIGENMQMQNIQIACAGGFDHNFVLDGHGFRKVVRLHSDKTNISMDVWTDKPGIQFYSGNFLSGHKGKSGRPYEKWSGLCLETQYFPNALANPHFPSPVLKAGQVYHFTTAYVFS